MVDNGLGFTFDTTIALARGVKVTVSTAVTAIENMQNANAATVPTEEQEIELIPVTTAQVREVELPIVVTLADTTGLFDLAAGEDDLFAGVVDLVSTSPFNNIYDTDSDLL